MPSSVPTPVAAALGIVPTVVGGVRRLPGKAVQLPVIALSSALNGLDNARREYDALAKRGEQLLARLRGTSLDQVEEVADDEEPKGMPTPKATQPDATRLDTAAARDVVQTVEQVAQQLGGEVPTHDNLPLPDYDHLTLGSLRGRMRSLDLPQLVAVREYEKAHADRLPIVTMLDNRIAKLASDPTAALSGGGEDPASISAPARAETGPATVSASKVSPATAAPTPPTASHGGLGDQNRPR
ncbi:MAG: hypothetical protein ACR2K2_02970 [Mycobacteriales bacterium]